MAAEKYPRVVIDLKKLRHNIDYVADMCRKQGIGVTGVIKGFTGIPQCISEYMKAGCDGIASSRISQLRQARELGAKDPLMLIRIPMLSEAEEVIEVADISLNSEVEVLRALNEEAVRQEKLHKVILMVDLGDLREGFWSRKELLEAALMTENELQNLELAGVGTNLGCYGSIAPTASKLEELVQCAEMIEEKIGRKLEYVSGGASTSLPRILDGDMPKGITNLRVGEGIILARDLQELWGYDMSGMYQDVFTLQAEIVEIKDKPSYPVGEIMFDAFGNTPEYTDRGIRKRALLAMGKVDYAYPEELLPRDKGIQVLGASSDHTIIDLEDGEKEYRIGDVLEFDLRYSTIVFATNCPDVNIVFA